MNIIFVDDQPEFKVQEAIKYLKEKKLKFDYSIFKSSNSALRYIVEKLSKIDLIILDLGLPKIDDNNYLYDKYEGLFVLEQILSKTKDIPIIINSTTVIKPTNCATEKEYFKSYSPAVIEHVEKLTGFYLFEFLETYLGEKVEFL